MNDIYADKAVGDLRKIYFAEEDKVPGSYEEHGLIQGMYNSMSAISSPAFVETTRRYEALKLASNCLRLAAMFHANIDADKGDLEEQAEKEEIEIPEEEDNRQYKVLVIFRYEDGELSNPVLVDTFTGRQSAILAVPVMVAEGVWVKYADKDKFIVPKNIEGLELELVENENESNLLP